MSSQRQRRSTSPRGSKAAGPAVGYETPEGIEQASNDIYAVPEGFDKAANQEELVRALQTMMSNFKKKTPSPSPAPPSPNSSESWNSSATPSTSPESRYVSGIQSNAESKAAPGLVNKMRARFQQQPEPAIALIPAERPGRKTPPKAAPRPRPRVRQTRKKTSTPSPNTTGPIRKVSSKEIKSKFDKKKEKRAPPRSSSPSQPTSRRHPKPSPRPNKTKKRPSSSSPKPEVPPRKPMRQPRLKRITKKYYQNMRQVHNEGLYENLGSIADKIRARESIYENVGKIMRDKFNEAQIDTVKSRPIFKKRESRTADPDYVYDEPFQQSDTLASALATNTTRVVQSKNHVLYRISRDGMCSLNSLFTLMGFSRLRIITPQDAKSSKTYIVSHSITPVYLIDFFKELSLITKPSCIPKIELIAQFLGFQCDYYQLKYADKFMTNLSKIINNKSINNRLMSYLQNLQLFIGASLTHTTSKQRAKFISDNNLQPINDAMDGDSFLGEIIEEYYKVKSGLDISSLTVTSTDIPQTNKFRNLAINQPFVEINSTAQIELPVNPFVLTKSSGNLTKKKENEIIQNTVYFLHSGRRSTSGTASSTKGHWDLVVPSVIHDFVESKKQSYTKNHEKWIQAFVDSQHKIMLDIVANKKTNHWMWYVFPSERPGQSDRRKIKMDLADYDKLFDPNANYIGFLSTWCDILKQIAEKMESDTTKDKNKWLHDERDRRRVGHCYSKYEEWFSKKFKPRNIKNIFAIKARFYLAYIYNCVTKGRDAGNIPRPR